MIEWDNGLRVTGRDLYLDSLRTRRRCFVSHAHSDHVASHEMMIATPATIELAAARIRIRATLPLEFGVDHELSDAKIRLLSVGHVLGSAMIYLAADEGTLLYTGDFKLGESRTVPQATPCAADLLIMETTFGKPMFRFPDRQIVVEELLERVGDALLQQIQPIVLGYSLGKAQELVRLLTDAGLIVTEYQTVQKMSDIYEKHGVRMGVRRRFDLNDFTGPAALPVEERGVLVAPPQVARTLFKDQQDKKVTIMCSGWAMLPGAKYRYGVDHALPLSDHADFDELMEMVDRVQPRRVLTVHGYSEFSDYLRGRGIDAELARPDPQMRLF